MPSPMVLIDVDMRTAAGYVPLVVEYYSHPMEGSFYRVLVDGVERHNSGDPNAVIRALGSYIHGMAHVSHSNVTVGGMFDILADSFARTVANRLDTLARLYEVSEQPGVARAIRNVGSHTVNDLDELKKTLNTHLKGDKP